MFAASKTASVSGGYQISRSLRFNSADTTYLTRTPSTVGNRQIWTLSTWVKRSALATNTFFSSDDNLSTSPYSDFYFNTSDALVCDFGPDASRSIGATTAVFRDVSAWYHIVIAVDTTQATSSNRVKVYVNNQLFGLSSYPAQNYNTDVNNTKAHQIGRRGGANDQYFNGYITETYLIDGQALTPSSFGETNAQTGVWQPKAYSGSYGTNGFYLNFSDNSNTTAATLGKDYSGNGNNWTPNNFSVTAGAGNDSLVDSPTSYGVDTGVGGTVRGNYSTLNALSTGFTLSNGNLNATNAATGNKSSYSTIGVSSGKWYAEAVWTTTGSTAILGVALQGYANTDGFAGGTLYSYGYEYTGQKYNNGSGVSYAATWTNGDVISVALDLDAGTITYYKNGTSQGTAFTGLPAGTYFIGVSLQSATCDINFGQRPFAYTAPSGFKALCTQNLPTPTIGATSATLANKYFEPTLYTGTNANLTVTNSGGFQPDFIWIKLRSSAGNHVLANSIGGPNKVMYSSQTTAEETSNAGTGITAITSTGFTLGTELAGTTYGSTNYNTYAYVAWNWKANGSGSTNTAGSITSTVSANTTSGFSVVTYTGTGANATVGHGLGIAPKMVIVKNRTSTGSWCTWHTGLTSGAYALFLESTDAQGSYPTIFNSTIPTSTVFSVGTATGTNASANNLVAYCFAEVAGYSKIGSYAGNGASDGPFIYTGFRPAYVMIKSTSLSQPWVVKDKLRAANYNPQDGNLYPNLSNAEDTTASVYIDLLSNGFKIRGDYAGINSGTSSYIFMAFAESPQKFSLAR